jgi:hypothetical protein
MNTMPTNPTNSFLSMDLWAGQNFHSVLTYRFPATWQEAELPFLAAVRTGLSGAHFNESVRLSEFASTRRPAESQSASIRREFALEACHADADRAFRYGGTAFQTQIERRNHLNRQPGFREPSVHRANISAERRPRFIAFICIALIYLVLSSSAPICNKTASAYTYCSENA